MKSAIGEGFTRRDHSEVSNQLVSTVLLPSRRNEDHIITLELFSQLHLPNAVRYRRSIN